ncbi:MAG: type I 3-dehydroquinate dehydratase [Nitrososphaeria archaeon]|jgi:3-dehydroquinate dehydratase type I|nr:type I 3-dehydroquinate dehydratase [Nitrososphaerota archaeon]
MVRIVVSLLGNTIEEMYKKISRTNENSLLELRLDSIKSLNPKDVPSYFSSVMDRAIITYRSPSEGGMSKDYKITNLIQLIELMKDYHPYLFDIEAESLKKISNSVDTSGLNMIISTHYIFTKPTAQDLNSFISEYKDKAKYLKIVNNPENITEALMVLSLYSGIEKGKLIAFSIGDKWSFTRYLSVVLGSPLIYTHLKNERVVEGMPEEYEAYEFVKFLKNWPSMV